AGFYSAVDREPFVSGKRVMLKGPLKMLSCSENSLAPAAERLPPSPHDHSRATTAHVSIAETHFGRIHALLCAGALPQRSCTRDHP
ncbi:hypothetical protein, partial [Paracoccus sp. FO-3]|uniref:hypothetical protein n=1 Tax=Paracoccus sp. FO-3 TaxID=1335059 RepID=UPI001C613343